jgi:hypothetical protein
MREIRNAYGNLVGKPFGKNAYNIQMRLGEQESTGDYFN